MIIMGSKQLPGRAFHRRALTSGVALGCSVGVSLALVTPAGADGSAAAAAPGVGTTARMPQLLPGAQPDPADVKRKVDARIRQLQTQVGETSSDLTNAYNALQSTQGKLPGARSALASAEAKAKTASTAYATAKQNLARAQAEEKKASTQLDETTTSMKGSRTKVAQFASQLYKNRGMGSLELAAGAGDPQEVADRMSMAGTVMGIQDASITGLATERATQKAQESKLTALRKASQSAEKKAKTALTAANDAKDKAADAKAALDKLAATQKTQHTTLQGQLKSERTKLSGMKGESDRLGEILRQRAIAAKKAEAARQAAAAKRAAEAARKAAAQRRSASGSGSSSSSAKSSGSSGSAGSSGSSESGRSSRSGFYLSSPAPGTRVSSEFGPRFHPILNYSRLHSGRDYAAPCGTPIRAAASGSVIMAGWGGGYGNRVVVAHGVHRGVDVTTTYNHLQSIAVHGGKVSRGQVIGYEGTTGLSTGCHLHFEVRSDGNPVDPRNWF